MDGSVIVSYTVTMRVAYLILFGLYGKVTCHFSKLRSGMGHLPKEES